MMKSIKTLLPTTWTILLVGLVMLIFTLIRQAPNNSGYHLGWVWPVENEPKIQDHVVGKDGTIYATDINGTLYAIQTPGQILWKYETSDGFIKPPILSHDGSTIFLVHVARVDAIDENGNKKWSHQLLDGVSISDPVIAAPNGDLDIHTFTSKGNNWGGGWFQVTPDGVFNQLKWPNNFHVQYWGIDRQGNIYTWEPGEKITVLNSKGDQILVCEEFGELVTPIVIDDDGNFFYVLSDGKVEAHNSTGNKIWEYSALELKIGWQSPTIPVVINNSNTNMEERVYLGGSEGQLYAIDASDGTLLWRTRRDPIAGSICGVVVGTAGDPFALTDKGILLAFGAQGIRLWSNKFYGTSKPGSLYINPQGELIGLRGGRIQSMNQNPATVFNSPTPIPRDFQLEIEDKVVSLMLQTATGDEKYQTLSSSIEPSWVRNDSRAILIVYAPVYEDIHANRVEIQADKEVPIKVWWYSTERLVKAVDPVKAYHEYLQNHSDSFGLTASIFTYGILSIDPSTQKVEIYYELIRDPLGGSGFLLTIQRDTKGHWLIIDDKFLWIS